ncbi:MAG: hypothetical protein HRT44_14190 [Bdellovibrionales bacterium]|nr:hypothetical protein [Bdellovibrionales bacterium]NQZ20388.1 hypothetical protein [Bdellovibrionales bacterium]
MKKVILYFVVFLIYPLNLSADDNIEMLPTENIVDPSEFFDELPITKSEVQAVSQLFWNAQSIQDKVKTQLPSDVRSRFTSVGNTCNIQNVTKGEGSADTCELTDDPAKAAQFIYHISVSCAFGNYRVNVCSRQENKLLNQLKVESPEKVVSDDNVFDLESTM